MNSKFTTMAFGFTILLSLFVNISFAQVANVSPNKFLMNIDGHTLKIPFYSNYDLYSTNPDVDKVVIVVHGSNRMADDHFENMSNVVDNVPALTANTLVLSPQFLIEDDINFHSLDAEHLYWTNGGWKSGANSKDEFLNPRPERIPSYAVLDSMFFHLAQQFPNLESIVFAGHSAGGQVAQRLAASSPMADILCSNFGISVRYVVSNPSSYLYMDGQRKEAGSLTDFSIPATSCDDYNEWKYGLEDLYTYPEYIGVDSIRNMNRRKSVIYLMGEDDDNPNSSSLDVSCRAELQGEHRYERSLVFFNYLQHYYGSQNIENHEFLSVPNVGHNSFEMYNSTQGHYALFEKPFVACSNFVDVIEIAEDQRINLYPNPAIDVLNISLPADWSGNQQLSIFDLHGRLLISKEVQFEDKINISSLNRGMYLLVIQSKGGSLYDKFIVK